MQRFIGENSISWKSEIRYIKNYYSKVILRQISTSFFVSSLGSKNRVPNNKMYGTS